MMRDHILVVRRTASESEELAAPLTKFLFRVLLAHSVSEARTVLSDNRIDAAVVDLDCLSLAETTTLIDDWHLEVVCVHRLANEKMWMDALAAGAIDCCYPDDHRHIIETLQNRNRRAQTRAAAA